jgi:hypothetical protein
MKKIKLVFSNDLERFAFYDVCWCKGYDYPQCETCERNRSRYENWQPPGCYTSFAFSEDSQKQAEAGNCQMYVDLGAHDVQD